MRFTTEHTEYTEKQTDEDSQTSTYEFSIPNVGACLPNDRLWALSESNGQAIRIRLAKSPSESLALRLTPDLAPARETSELLYPTN